MKTTSELKPCPRCGSPIPPEAPQGLCPKCLLGQASLPTETGTKENPRPAPPSHETLARAFPQLEILDLVGQGGMGFVFKARQPKIGRLVALKILPQSFAADPAFADRFAREARILARLNHPNIITLYDFGQANGFFYLLMEFVDGVNLRQAMQTGRFTPEQALGVVPSICDALQFAHNEGVLHRDIKPENILLDTKGRIKIADFGIAKLLGEAQTGGNLTGSGGTLGTPHYMAPEQIEKPAAVDHRADIYSLGVVFYEMLTGELPLGRFAPPSQKVQVDVRLDEVVLHALEKEPARRYQQASELKTDVKTIAEAPGTTRPTVGSRSETYSRAKERPDHFWRRLALGGALGILVLILGSALLSIGIYWRARQARAQAVEAERAARRAAEHAHSLEVEPGKLVIGTEKFEASHREPGQLDWGFKLFIPRNKLATALFVQWSNGVPSVEPSFSAYYKVKEEGGIDVPFCSISCYPIPATTLSRMTNSENRLMLARWGIPDPAAATNVVQWNVNSGLGFTSSRWIAMPAYHRKEVELPQSVDTGQQLSFPLVQFEPVAQPSNGWSGIELRFSLEPLREPPVRMRPNEKDMTNYVGGTGLIGTKEQARARITQRRMPP